jgi:type IV secretion system protein VirB11
VYYRIAQLAKESEAGQGMDYQYILNIVKSTIDVVCFFERTQLKEIYYDPFAKRQALQGNQ